MYGSHDVRHVDFRELTVVNETPRDKGVTISTKPQSKTKARILKSISLMMVMVEWI